MCFVYSVALDKRSKTSVEIKKWNLTTGNNQHENAKKALTELKILKVKTKFLIKNKTLKENENFSLEIITPEYHQCDRVIFQRKQIISRDGYNAG